MPEVLNASESVLNPELLESERKKLMGEHTIAENPLELRYGSRSVQVTNTTVRVTPIERRGHYLAQIEDNAGNVLGFASQTDWIAYLQANPVAISVPAPPEDRRDTDEPPKPLPIPVRPVPSEEPEEEGMDFDEASIDTQYVGQQHDGCIVLKNVAQPTLADIVIPKGTTPLIILGGNHGLQRAVPDDSGVYVDKSKSGNPKVKIYDGYLLVTNHAYMNDILEGRLDRIPPNSPIRQYAYLFVEGMKPEAPQAVRPGPLSAEAREIIKEYPFLSREIQAARYERRSKQMYNEELRAYMTKEDEKLNEQGLVKHIFLTHSEVATLMRDQEALIKAKEIYGDLPIVFVLVGAPGPYLGTSFYSRSKGVVNHFTAGSDAMYIFEEGKTEIGEVMLSNGMYVQKYHPSFYNSFGGSRSQVGDDAKSHFSGIEIFRSTLPGQTWEKLPDGTRLHFPGMSGRLIYQDPTPQQIVGLREFYRTRNFRQQLEEGMEPSTDPADWRLRMSDSQQIVRPGSTEGSHVKTDLHSDWRHTEPALVEFVRVPAKDDAGNWTPEFRQKCKDLLSARDEERLESLLPVIYAHQQRLLRFQNLWRLPAQLENPNFQTENYVLHKGKLPDVAPTLGERTFAQMQAWELEKLALRPFERAVVTQCDQRYLGITEHNNLIIRNLPGPKPLHEIVTGNIGQFFYVWSEVSRSLQQVERIEIDYEGPVPEGKPVAVYEYVYQEGESSTPTTVIVQNKDKIFPDRATYYQYVVTLAMSGRSVETPPEFRIPFAPVERGETEAPQPQSPWYKPKQIVVENGVEYPNSHYTEKGAVIFTNLKGGEKISDLVPRVEETCYFVLLRDPERSFAEVWFDGDEVFGISTENQQVVDVSPSNIALLFPDEYCLRDFQEQPGGVPIPAQRVQEREANTSVINSPYLEAVSNGVYRVRENIGNLSLREILEQASVRPEEVKLYVIRADGQRIFTQWGEDHSAPGESYNLVNFEMDRVKIRPGDTLSFDISDTTPEQDGRSDISYLPEHMRHLARRVRAMDGGPLSTQEISPETQELVETFKAPFKDGALRLARNLASRGISLTKDSPVCVSDLSSNKMAVYVPGEGIREYDIMWSSHGFGNKLDCGGQMLGSSQIGAIRSTGRGETAYFSQKSTGQSLREINMERYGLDTMETVYTPKGRGENVSSKHNMDRAYGNENSASINIEGADLGNGTSIHGVDGSRMNDYLNGNVQRGTRGCIGMRIPDARALEAIILKAREDGFNAYEETQY